MNTTYIAQCAAAKKLQKRLRDSLKVGECVRLYNKRENTVTQVVYDEANYRKVLFNLRTGWWFIILQQEQLWAMLPKENSYDICSSEDGLEGSLYWSQEIIKKRRLPSYEEVVEFNGYTFESILLEMFMLANHNKTWNKGAWV